MEVMFLGFWYERGIIVLGFFGFMEREWEKKEFLFFLLNMAEGEKWNFGLVKQAESVNRSWQRFAYGNDVIDDVSNSGLSFKSTLVSNAFLNVTLRVHQIIFTPFLSFDPFISQVHSPISVNPKIIFQTEFPITRSNQLITKYHFSTIYPSLFYC